MQYHMLAFIAHLCMCACTFDGIAQDYKNYAVQYLSEIHQKLLAAILCSALAHKGSVLQTPS